MTKKQATTEETSIRVLKKADCPTLSGKSTLTYQIGCTDTAEIMLRITGNTNPGYFNTEWVPYAEVQALLTKQDQGKAITSFVLTPLYRGKSTNSPSFLFAVLKQEGLVKLSESKRRCYDRCSDAAFLDRVQKLIDGKGAPAVSSKAKPGKNNKGKVAEVAPVTITEAAQPEPASQEPAEKPLFVLTDVPDNKPVKRGRPKKAQPMDAAQGDAVNPVEAP
jgi:hypothetical protein